MHNSFSLFETMYFSKKDGYRYYDFHLKRLISSAIYFGFSYNERTLRESLRTYCEALPSTGAQQVKLTLFFNGHCSLQSSNLKLIKSPVKLLISKHYMKSDQLFLRHKTTFREIYDWSWQEAERVGAFDMLFFNQQGELTEGARSNVFLKLKGNWYTPRLSSGLLPGVMRSVILDDPNWGARECILKIEDLLNAEDIMVCNTLRGAVSASLPYTVSSTPHCT